MLNLNKRAIEAANSASQFEAGNVLAREAEAVYQEGISEMQKPFNGVTLNDQQSAMMARRLDEWKSLVEKAYNEIISRRASWVPWTVSGPARYNSKRNSARADKQMEAAAEWNEKMNRFIENTVQLIRDAIPADEMIAEYRSGKRREAISSDDPAAADKLQARIEYLKEQHERGKAMNTHWRKHKTMRGFPGLTDAQAAKLDAALNDPGQLYHVPYAPYQVQNMNANIKRLEGRLKTIHRQQEVGDTEKEYNGFTVNASGTEGRINITFSEKPSDAARSILKSNGFHWSPRNKVWTRQLTANASFALRRNVLPGLLALDEYAENEPPASDAITLDDFAARHA